MTNEELWTNALSDIEVSVSRANFATWFKDTAILDNADGSVTIAVPNGFAKEWLENKYHKFILKSLRLLSPEVRAIQYTIKTPAAIKNSINNPRVKPNKDAPSQNFSNTHDDQLDFKEFQVDPRTNLNQKYTFDSFIVGPFNELAYTAALSVIKSLGKVYNPLFIYGGVGLGKTHLLQAIGNSVLLDNPQRKVKYISSEKFSNEIVTAIQQGTIQTYKEKYRDYNLLIVDDIQFFAGKTKTQEEFFYTFNALYEAGNQVVFSSDRSPKSIPDIEERLRSRFEAGVIIDISEPEYESRLAILRSKVKEKNINLPEQSLEIIASMVQTNIRELEGALNVVQMQSRYHNKTLSNEELKSILSKNLRPKTSITPNQIIKIVADYYGISERIMSERTRKTDVVLPRQIAMYLIREDLQGSYPAIGDKFGGRDHTTAIHAYEKIKADIKKNTKLEEDIKVIREHYQNHP
jgi:chromosomal replication initiator protein